MLFLKTNGSGVNNVFQLFFDWFSIVFSEENVYKLCQEVASKHPSEIQKCYVVFVSNVSRTVPLWRQKAGKDEDRLVIWVSINTLFFSACVS